MPDPLFILQVAPATMALLITNLIITLVAFQNVRLTEQLIFDINHIRRKHQYYRFVTSAFIHGDGFHVFMNLLALYFMGPFLEVQIGTGAFVAIYFACLLGGSAWTYLDHFRDSNYRALGASGAISGIMAAASLFGPLQTILVFFVLPMPFILATVLYVGWSIWASHNQLRDGIGHAAHLGGALMGVALVCLLYPQVARNAFDDVVAAVTPG
jgi:membrane associated rhomboid family serine protease